MLNNFRNLNSLFRSLGARWLAFRVAYALRMRTGLIRKQIPAYHWHNRPLETWLKRAIPFQPEAYTQWRRQNSPAFFFQRPALPESMSWDPQLAVNEAERVLNGELKYFAHTFIRTGFPPDWHRDPVSGIKVDATKHWSEISNDADVDIKFVWEASRFSLVYTLVRAYAHTRDEKYAEAFWELIQSWAESNSPNRGPNWMDGQEAALRLMAWTFGYYAFLDSPSATPERIAQFTVLVAAHAERIYKNIGYAISTHSNHTISEAFGLWLTGLLFPELRDADKYSAVGGRLLEQEALAQIFPDGSYAMYSLNYHRFILHIYLYAMRLGELHHSPVSSIVHQRVTASIDYLSQLIDPETGQMPVYGSNDGALVLPLNNCDFSDYRPLLQLGSYLTRKQFLFDPGPWEEDVFWLFGSFSLEGRLHSAPQGGAGVRVKQASFPHAGIHLLRDASSKAIIRCTHFRSRPSHADQLHVDLWWQGYNIACDAGTYLYTGEGIWRNGLAHTAVHNTVTVDHQDQMKMVSRFVWTNWANGKVLEHSENSWQGEHDGYRRLPDPVTHKRTVLSLGEDRWLVVDHLEGKQPHQYALHWLLGDYPYEQDENSIVLTSIKCKVQVGLVEGRSTFSVLRVDPNSTRGWRSRYYGEKEPAISTMLEAHQAQALFWSFFGLEGDSLELAANVLKLQFARQEISIDLHSTRPVSTL